MKQIKHTRNLLCAGMFVVTALLASRASLVAADDSQAWPEITSQARPWVWWWWHGSAVDETNISHELQRFHDVGLGGVQITSIYGTKGAEARDIPYLTPEWLKMMGYTVDEAHWLGMGVDMTLGSGWCFGGPTVSDEDANASVVVRTFKLNSGEKLTEKFNLKTTQALIAFAADGKSTDLAGSIAADGTVSFSPLGNCVVYAISQKPSGQKVKRAGPGGEGWMLNPAYPQAMRDWLPWFDKALSGYSGSKPHGVFQDSYEYRTDWSPVFFARFEKSRGYKLQTELPALFGEEQSDRAARVKYDYRLTLSEIMVKQSEPVWIDWARKNGFASIYQAHGTPGNWLDLYGEADIPETEMFHNDRNILISKFASSAAHTQGRPLTGAETGTWLKEHFTETLADLKGVADDMFLSGVNHIYYHGTCYSPDDAAWPGWLFYASTEMNPRNPIWHDVPVLNEYIARCQSVLQSGKPDNDVLLYWPVADFWSNPSGRVLPMTVSSSGWFEDQPVSKTAHDLWDAHYAFDYVSDSQLQKAKVVDGEIQMPGGRYRTVVVPECKLMPLETLEKLVSLAKSGAKVIFEKDLPKDVPGLGDLEKQRATFKSITGKIKPEVYGKGLTKANVGKGSFLFGWAEAFLSQISRENSDFPSVRRAVTGGEYYFIANRTGTNFDGWSSLPGAAKSVVAMDPMSGRVGSLECQIWPSQMGEDYPFRRTQVHLQLAPGQSIILRTFMNKKVAGTAWDIWQTNGQPVEIGGQWKVNFLQGGPSLPAASQTDKLASWTTFPDTNAQAFAGTAKYGITFDAPDSAGKHFEINLGDVRQSARVKLNGKDYGTLIMPPFKVVVDNLKATGNQLEVEVTSVAANRIRDLDRRGVQWKIFKDINVVNVNYRPFDASDWPLTDCGLLGPVMMTAVHN